MEIIFLRSVISQLQNNDICQTVKRYLGMTLGAAMGKTERQEEWRELVVRSSVAPNGPLRLRDRQDKISQLENNDICQTVKRCICIQV